jgi:hypothetical protein
MRNFVVYVVRPKRGRWTGFVTRMERRKMYAEYLVDSHLESRKGGKMSRTDNREMLLECGNGSKSSVLEDPWK